MIRALSIATLLATTLLSGCTIDEVCAYLGDYSGTFSGDASGALTISIAEGDDADHALATITLEGEEFSAVGEGEVHCEDGELLVTLFDAEGNEIGTFDGSMYLEEGEWSLESGEAGTWAIEAEE